MFEKFLDLLVSWKQRKEYRDNIKKSLKGSIFTELLSKDFNTSKERTKHPLHDEKIKDFYKSDTDGFKLRIDLLDDVLEKYFKEHSIEQIKEPVYEEWNKIKKICLCYYIVPEEEDIKKLVNKHYDKNLQ